jgi:hypothetical protein
MVGLVTGRNGQCYFESANKILKSLALSGTLTALASALKNKKHF